MSIYSSTIFVLFRLSNQVPKHRFDIRHPITWLSHYSRYCCVGLSDKKCIISFSDTFLSSRSSPIVLGLKPTWCGMDHLGLYLNKFVFQLFNMSNWEEKKYDFVRVRDDLVWINPFFYNSKIFVEFWLAAESQTRSYHLSNLA